MTGLLRFVGLLNAAVWLGAGVFCSTVLLVAMNSREAVALVGAAYAEQVAGGLTQIIVKRWFHLQIFCAVVAGLHAAGERLYLGRVLRRFWAGLLGLLFLIGFLGSVWLGPKLVNLQRAQFVPALSAEARVAAQRRFDTWHAVFQVVNVAVIAGVGLHLWRLGNPQDEALFVMPTNFRV
jgi:hypothetical protein